jgi:ATP-dependent DNA helicase RecG
VLEFVYREQPIPGWLKPCLPQLIEIGVVEALGRGRSAKYILSRRFYEFLGEKGVYTRKRGLDRETNKALLLKHIQSNMAEGSQLRDLQQVLPGLSRDQIQKLVRELKDEQKIFFVGRTSDAKWYPTETS